ncbi:MAG: 16S rRNA (cytidine(1402)-2'-O)-methyltransferase [Desulfuromonadales bacterium]|nr:16S rRNA (cytidine(1402)-2'-O)-methyltransferase [Desulfuromonadales bacterium]
MSGTLYLVATPIGNLEDITLRALRILKEVDLIACEDTRHSRKLLNHYGISTTLTAYHQHNEEPKAEKLVEKLQDGKSIALISDAGTPGISDPGYRIVVACRNANLQVVAIPGPSAVISALAISGLPTDAFVFAGFLPAKSTARREALTRLRAEQRTTLFYEAPHRLGETLAEIVEELGAEREVAVARELTKIHEELVRGRAEEVQQHFAAKEIKGEIVLLVGPATAAETPTVTVKEALAQLLAEGMLLRAAVKQVAKAYGLPGDEVYKEALSLRTAAEE